MDNDDKPKKPARIKRKSELAGMGCLIQVIGLALPVIGLLIAFIPGAIVGGILGLVMFAVGSRKALKYICGECGNPVDSKRVKLCPACKCDFK